MHAIRATRSIEARHFAPRRGYLRLFAILAMVAAVGLGIESGGGALRRAGLLTSTERYVALSFADPASLPTHARAGEVAQFVFDVNNQDAKEIHQPWRVDVTGSDGSGRVVAEGTANVPPSGMASIDVRFVMPSSAAPETVTVSAPGQHLAPLQFFVGSSVAKGPSS